MSKAGIASFPAGCPQEEAAGAATWTATNSRSSGIKKKQRQQLKQQMYQDNQQHQVQINSDMGVEEMPPPRSSSLKKGREE